MAHYLARLLLFSVVILPPLLCSLSGHHQSEIGIWISQVAQGWDMGYMWEPVVSFFSVCLQNTCLSGGPSHPMRSNFLQLILRVEYRVSRVFICHFAVTGHEMIEEMM